MGRFSNTSPLQQGTLIKLAFFLKEKPKLGVGVDVPDVLNGVTYPPKLNLLALNTKGRIKQASWLGQPPSWADSSSKHS